MKIPFEYKIVDPKVKMEKNDGGHGERDLIDPIMIYAQIPIERKRFLKLIEECKERKISIYDLLQNAVDNETEELDQWY